MSKETLTRDIAKRAGVSRKDAASVVDAFTAAVTEALARGDAVRILGFGEFTVKTRAARTGRDLRTGATVTVPARRIVAFRAGKALRVAVAGK